MRMTRKPERPDDTGRTRWLKVAGILLVLVVLLIIAMMLGGGFGARHRAPFRHGAGSGNTQPASAVAAGHTPAGARVDLGEE